MPLFSNDARRWRMATRHRLTPALRTDSITDITNDLIALHSSDPATVFMSCFARMSNPAVATVEQALYDHRSVVRHHAMRRTMWVMAPDTARLAHGAATAKIARAERKRTVDAMADSTDIDDPEAWLDHALREIVALLDTEGELSTRQIGKALPHLVVPVTFGVRQKQSTTVSAHTKVLQGAGFGGHLLRGRPTASWNSAEYRWNQTVLWMGAPLPGLAEQPAAADLVHRWLQRFGPATITDIRWWFGWTATLTKRALAEAGADVVQLEDGADGFVAVGDADVPDDPGPWVQLLPGLDPTAMGWKERDWYLDPTHVKRLFDRFGNAGPTVWADGRIVGGWGQRAGGTIGYELTSTISGHHQQLLDTAVDRMQTALDGVVVRPRFPAPLQRDLAAS